jgi:hypothetical protein
MRWRYPGIPGSTRRAPSPTSPKARWPKRGWRSRSTIATPPGARRTRSYDASSATSRAACRKGGTALALNPNSAFVISTLGLMLGHEAIDRLRQAGISRRRQTLDPP